MLWAGKPALERDDDVQHWNHGCDHDVEVAMVCVHEGEFVAQRQKPSRAVSPPSGQSERSCEEAQAFVAQSPPNSSP